MPQTMEEVDDQLTCQFSNENMGKDFIDCIMIHLQQQAK
jgi:hypothetical protein